MKKRLLLFSIGVILGSCESKKLDNISISNSDSAVAHGYDSVLADIDRKVAERKKIPIESRVAEVYKTLNTKDDSNVTNAMYFNSFDEISEDVVGTKFEKRVNKTRDSLDRIVKKEEAMRGFNNRKQYGKDFENLLLDKGLNIKVSVSGKDNKKITLKYIRFDEVWRRQFETLGYFDQLHEKGFDEICLTDGYDYHECWGY